MAKDKDKTLNPAAVHLKSEKAKALKKGKAAILAQRTTRLASRNPSRLERQISDLKALEASSGGKLSVRDKKQLEELQRDVERVKKARVVLGDKAPKFGDGRTGGNAVRSRGEQMKRKREERRGKDFGDNEGSGSETDESVKRIPMPSDTPPPIPFQPRLSRSSNNPFGNQRGNANMEPLGSTNRGTFGEEQRPSEASLPPRPETHKAQTVYESKPVVRDLQKEAVKAFMPAAVARKVAARAGKGSTLLEEKEVERLEKEGYGAKTGDARRVVVDAAPRIEEPPLGEKEQRRLQEEEEAFGREIGMDMMEEGEERASRGVRMEEVEDEDY